MPTELSRANWALLVIAESGDRPLEPVQLQKSLFLLGRNMSGKQLHTAAFYCFSAYDYGPFCADVYFDAENLETAGLVEITRPEQARFRRFKATSNGRKVAEKLRDGLEPTARDYLQRVVAFTTSVDFNTLVSAIYKAYPEMKANSVFDG